MDPIDDSEGRARKQKFSALQDALARNPDGYGENRDLAQFLMGLRNFALAAEPYLKKAFEVGGEVAAGDESLVYHQGIVHILKAEFHEALSVFEDLYRRDAGNLLYLFYLGDAHFRLGEIDTASTLYRRGANIAYQRAKAACLKLDEPVTQLLYPSAVVCRSFGEMASKLDLFVKARVLGWVDETRVILTAPAADIVNRCLMAAFADHLEIITDPVEIAAVQERYPDNRLILDYYRLPDGRVVQRDLAYPFVQRQWEADGRAPVLALTEGQKQDGREALRRLGVPDDAWFAALHVRDPGFFNEDLGLSPNTFRNVDIGAYGPAIEAIVERGGWVVRLGDQSAPPLPSRPGVVDYARSDERSPEMDVFCCAACRFFVGSDSGPVWVAGAFGVPVVETDWSTLGVWPVPEQDIFVPKTLRDAEGRAMSLSQMVESAFYGVTAAAAFERRGIAVVDNGPEDIRDAVVEMIDRLEGTIEYSDEDERLQARFRELADPYGVGISSRVGQGFLRRHPELLEDG
jgi:putative glycosyltransferase (TIGR04372 family)